MTEIINKPIIVATKVDDSKNLKSKQIIILNRKDSQKDISNTLKRDPSIKEFNCYDAEHEAYPYFGKISLQYFFTQQPVKIGSTLYVATNR